MLPNPINDIIEKVRTFASLPDGWNYGEGSAPSDRLIENAIDLILCLYNKQSDQAPDDCEVFPGTEGEILVVLYYGSETLEVELTRKNNIIGEPGD